MRDKNVAGILGLFFGWIGVHRFYLGQVGLGILYAILAMTGISFILGLIDAIVFFSMDKDNFDIKYNAKYFEAVPREKSNRDYEYERRRQRRSGRDHRGNYRQEEKRRSRPSQRPKPKSAPSPPPARPRSNPYKKSGIEKYKEYDYDGAIEDFKKALEISPKDIAVHFNLACAYSLNEKADLAFSHLDKAVRLGFDDVKRIKEHDALAYLRIQDDFEAFEKNNFRLPESMVEEQFLEENAGKTGQEQLEDEAEETFEGSNDLLEQLNKLSELRKKGLLTEEEFTLQKRKLLN